MAEDVPDQHSADSVRIALDAALANRDRPTAVRAALNAVRSGIVDIETLYTSVLIPVLVRLGASWSHGHTAIWEEHYATATVRTIVEALYLDVVAAAENAAPRGSSALLACPQGEAHDLGLRMLADRMLLAGWEVHYLGADTPTLEIAEAARALRVDLVALSAATHYNLVELRGVLVTLHRELPDVRIGVGGPAFAHGGIRDVDHLTEQELGLRPATGA